MSLPINRTITTSRRRNTKRTATAVKASAAFLLSILIAGCTQSSGLSQQFKGGVGYVTGDGVYTEVKAADRRDPIEFRGTTAAGSVFDSRTYKGRVLVVNFWYASCPPCRTEARNLQAVSQKYANHGVQFIGVNTRDRTPQIEGFDKTFGVSYPSILDIDKSQVQLAFSGSIAPNSTPTTIVLDRRHRVAVRVLGAITDRSILAEIVKETLEQ